MQNEPFQNDPFCIEAEYVITTFSVGVLQAGVIGFDPPLPQWKKTAINTMQMGVYFKIIMQFPSDQVFWNRSTEFFLHVNPKRGYYHVFPSLDHENFHPGSGILFVTVVGDEAYRNYFGFLQGAYFEGKEIGDRIVAKLNGDHIEGAYLVHYEDLVSSVTLEEYTFENGWKYNTWEAPKARMRGRRLKRGFAC
jgi:hypothetical protein